MVILYDRFNLPGNIYEVIFATKQQIVVAKLLIQMIKEQGGEIGKYAVIYFHEFGAAQTKGASIYVFPGTENRERSIDRYPPFEGLKFSSGRVYPDQPEGS